MTLCNYFINGNCRFGSKCVNDHIDVKKLIKNEAEAVIQGKQWLLSCHGPFKESICIPNFIQDQSFEELRIGYIESSANGTIQQYLTSLINEYNSALSKMNELKTASPEIIQVIASIYKTSSEQNPTSGNQAANPTSSVFGSTATPAVASNPFGANIFGSTNQQSSMSTSSIFGNSTSSNPFQQQSQTQQASSSIFGGSSVVADQKSSFSFAQPAVKSSIFGSSVFGSTQAQHQQQPVATNTSIFGQAQPQAQVNPFSQPAPQSNIFAQQSNANIFGQPSLQSPVAPAPSIFGAPSSIQQPQPPSSIFGSTNAFQQQQQVPQQAPPQQMSVFGSSNTFPRQATPPPAQNVFAIQQPGATANINPFQQTQTQAITIHPTAYSKPEELSAEELQAFQAPNFTLGLIPLKPPSQNLCT